MGQAMRRLLARITAAAIAAALQACATAPVQAPVAPVSQPAAEARQPVTILVSIDGFRPDYLARGVTPVLSALAAGGVSGALTPSFPSKTFPNHWTLVTGLTPDRHGIVANRMEDAARPGQVFTMATDDPFWWSDALPVWVEAERAGIRTGTVFWPGSNVPFGETRPADWLQFNQKVPEANRVRTVLDWMRRPAEIRPRFVTLYFDSVDTAGHGHGPDAPATNAAIGAVDAEVGALRDGLAALGQPANLVIVSDHGMIATSAERTVRIDGIVGADGRVVEEGPYAGIAPQPGRAAALAARLSRPHPHMQCWPKERLPARFAYGRNPRIPTWLCLAEPGWLLVTKPLDPAFAGGNHGYDPALPEMAAVFVASGPAFRAGARLPAAEPNTGIAVLLRRLIGLPAGEGDAGLARAALAAE